LVLCGNKTLGGPPVSCQKRNSPTDDFRNFTTDGDTLAILEGIQLDRIADHVDDAKLNFSLGKHRPNRVGKSLRPSTEAIKISLAPRFPARRGGLNVVQPDSKLPDNSRGSRSLRARFLLLQADSLTFAA